MSGIFIDYRREDSGGEAAHLRDDLVERFGEDNNARMPASLPPEIQQLRHLQAAPLRNPDWQNDVAGLVGRLQQFVPVAPPVQRGDASTTRLVPWPARVLLVVFLVIFVVIFAAAVAFIVSTAGTVLGG